MTQHRMHIAYQNNMASKLTIFFFVVCKGVYGKFVREIIFQKLYFWIYQWNSFFYKYFKARINRIIYNAQKNISNLKRFSKTCPNYFRTRRRAYHIEAHGKNKILIQSTTPYREIQKIQFLKQQIIAFMVQCDMNVSKIEVKDSNDTLQDMLVLFN